MGRAGRTTVAVIAAVLVLVLALVRVALPVVMTRDTGTWPADWPKELEPLRKSAKTIEVATGVQQNIYEITFHDRETFEKAWPALLHVKTPGAPLTLYKRGSAPPKDWGSLLSNAAPAVRVYAPTNGYAGEVPVSSDGRIDADALKAAVAEGRVLKAGPPWPDGVASAKGELPEYVVATKVDGKLVWVEGKPNADKPRGFLNRARVDVELVVDGNVIDLNRVPLPGDTLVVDRRFP